MHAPQHNARPFGTRHRPDPLNSQTPDGRLVGFGGWGDRFLNGFAYAAALLCALPIVSVIIAASAGNVETVTRLGISLLPSYAMTTFWIMVMVGLGTAIVGTGTAWLVTACDFAGRKWIEVALVVPLAFPAYVLAYAYTDLLDHPGAVQTALRSIFGWGPREYWFPEVRSPGGSALMLTLVLYPYVYLLARTAFLMQGLAPFIVAKSLGSSNHRAFWKIAVPLIAPAVSAGVLLALMETIADFGTVAHFGVHTLATGIYISWFTLGDRAASAQMALGLLAIALLLFALEGLRAKNSDTVSQNANRDRWPRMRLKGGRALAAAMICIVPILFGAIIPTVMLFLLAQRSAQNVFSERYWNFLSNSLILASVAALVTVIFAIALSYGRRRNGDRVIFKGSFTVARLGYAVPGAVIALGLFVPIATLENLIDKWARNELGFSTGLFLSGTITVLIAAYVIRFLAAALGAWRAGEVTVTRDLDRAAEGMGASTGTILRRIHVPMLAPAAFTAMLLVFVDTIKELPATLIIRPFGWDTLAVQAYRLAADERLEGAAIPSLIIVGIGLIPVVILCRRLNIH